MQRLRCGPIENSYSRVIHSAVLHQALTLRNHLSRTRVNDWTPLSADTMAFRYPMLWFVGMNKRHVGVNEVRRRVSSDSGAIRSGLVRWLKGGASWRRIVIQKGVPAMIRATPTLEI
jgi:hypothetical protein